MELCEKLKTAILLLMKRVLIKTAKGVNQLEEKG
jgi:hypothetical protein